MKTNVSAYQAFKSHDVRFDGVFYVGVTTTGIFCRPICPAKTPQLKNCRFFETAEAAEKAGFRACLRCRPELAPGQAPVDKSRRIALLMGRRLEEGLDDEVGGVEGVAAFFGISSRQLRRILQKELGVSPVELLQTRRLLLAKQLLSETKLSVTEIAFASGFASLRRFNDAFRSRYRMPPTRLRQQVSPHAESASGVDCSCVDLSYRPPYEWDAMLAFLRTRMIRGVEFVTAESYSRTVEVGKHRGWIRVTAAPRRHSLRVQFSHSLMAVLPTLLARLRNLFDLTARPDLIAAHLEKDKVLRPLVKKHPGLRVPGAFAGFEMAVRAILGQQITVKAATTLAGRFAEAFGEKITTPFPELTRLSPLASRICGAAEADMTRLGIVNSRSKTLIALARRVTAGELNLEMGFDPEGEIQRLVEIPGIGPWTAHYLAMRALRWPDAFPKEDLVIRKQLGGLTGKQAEERSQQWSPWRSYAVMHLWKNSV